MYSESYRADLGSYWAQGNKGMVIRNTVLTCVAQYEEGIPDGGASAPNSQDEVLAILNVPAVCGADEKCRKVKHIKPTQGLHQPCWCIGWAGGEDLGICEGPTLGREEADRRTFPFKLLLHQYSTNLKKNLQQISNIFQTSFITNFKICLTPFKYSRYFSIACSVVSQGT